MFQPVQEIWFDIEIRGGALVVSSPQHKFEAVYYKPLGRPHLALRQCTPGHHSFLALASRAANDMARDLGWI